MTPTKILAWHFIRPDRRLGYGDGRAVVPGETISVDVTPELCCAGLHASTRAIDALGYAPGPIVCRVEVWGNAVVGDDKVVGQHRRCLWVLDSTETLRAWARWCAIQVIHLWDAPDVVREYLRTGREDIRDAAWAAAWDAAGAAAGDAAGDAAWAAAWDVKNAELEQLLLAARDEAIRRSEG